jgi:diguanylate cyclase (GGDEF)-like protein
MPDAVSSADLLIAAENLAKLESQLSESTEEPSDDRLHALESLATQAERLASTARAVARRRTPPHAPDPAIEAVSASPRPRLLLIDDDRRALQALAELLEPDFEVIANVDGREALRHASHPLVDAVVTDLRMPHLDGLEVLRRLRADPATAEVPCLLLTAADATEEKLSAFGLGAADYLTKPVNVAELTARLHHRIAEARRLAHERRMRETDELTGMPNRHALMRGLAEHFAEARTHRSPLTLALVDMDGLKRINDTWGHPAGDRAICAVARAMQRCCRAHDLSARLGGDEFALLMPATDLAGAERLLARVDTELARIPLELADARVPVRISHGLAIQHEQGDSVSQLMARADEALYACKRRHHAVGARE